MSIMDCEGSVLHCEDCYEQMLLKKDVVSQFNHADPTIPLGVEEVIACLRRRWQATYDLRLVVRRESLYLQVMWGYLEQQSFPLNEHDYRIHLSEVLEVVNRIGMASVVREWLETTTKKPRLGRAISLPLKGHSGINEFVLGTDQ